MTPQQVLISQKMQELMYERETAKLKHKWRIKQIEKETELEKLRYDLRTKAAEKEAKNKSMFR